MLAGGAGWRGHPDALASPSGSAGCAPGVGGRVAALSRAVTAPRTGSLPFVRTPDVAWPLELLLSSLTEAALP